MPTLQVIIDAQKAKDGSIQFKSAVKEMKDGARELDSSLDKTGGKIQKTGGFFSTLAGRLSLAAAAYAGFRTLQSSVSLFGKWQEGIAQLNAGLRSTHAVSGQTIASMTKLADQIQLVTKYSNDDVIAAEAILLSFTNIADDVFPRAIKATADISSRMGTDLKGSLLQVAKALNDPIANLSAMSRAGIQFSESQKTVINQLWKTGQQAEAQRVILAELERQYEGSAEAAGDTLAGKLVRLKNAWEDLLKVFAGVALQDVLQVAIKGAIGYLNDLTEYITKNQVAVRSFFIDVTAFGRKAWAFIILVVKGVKELVVFLAENVGPILEKLWGAMSKLFGFVSDKLIKILGGVFQEFGKLGKAFEEIDKWAANMKMALTDAGEVIGVLGAGINQVGENFFGKFRRGWDLAVQGVDKLSLAAEGMGQAFGKALEDSIMSGESLQSVMQSLLLDIERALLRALVIEPIVAGLTGGIKAAFSPSPSANGNVFNAGMITPYASGGIVSRPTLFPMKNGMGLMGERGPEAIMPLARDASGRLGVRGGQSTNISINVNTPDANSFRKSEKQIAASVRRALRGV